MKREAVRSRNDVFWEIRGGSRPKFSGVDVEEGEIFNPVLGVDQRELLGLPRASPFWAILRDVSLGAAIVANDFGLGEAGR